MEKEKQKENKKEEQKRQIRETKGITLITLVVTIIVIMILATITMKVTIGENGLLKQAKAIETQSEGKVEGEKQELNRLLVEYANVMKGEENSSGEGEEPETNTVDPTPPVEVIDKTSKVGYYADLAVGGSGYWGDGNGAYSYGAITGTKNYYISKTNHVGAFGTRDVLTATGSGSDRFYVMALTDFNVGTKYYWYTAAYGNMSDYTTTTSTDFGTGKANTEAMITKWKTGAYGTQNNQDMWGAIQEEVAKGWFVPSKSEWSAFGSNLVITKDNYQTYGLSEYYWSSSQINPRDVWYTHFGGGYMYDNRVNLDYYVRLIANF